MRTKDKITISVVGPTGSGKTKIIAIIASALMAHDIKVENLSNEAIDELDNVGQLQDDLRLIAQTSKVYMLEDNIPRPPHG